MKKIITSFLIYSLAWSFHFFAEDIRDAKGRTSLMQAVIDFQIDFSAKQEDEKRLWHVCYEYANIIDGYITIEIDPTTSYSKPVYKREVRRRISCLDSDIEAHRKCARALYTMVEDTIKKIRKLVEVEHVAVAALDHDGYSALNYCYTREIYDELRRSGVPFQFKVWTYFHPRLTVFGSVVIATGLYKGYCNYKS